MKKIATTAEAVVSIKISLASNWEEGCPVSQVHKQAAEEATNKILKLLNNDLARGMTLQGGIKIKAIITEMSTIA